MYSKFTIARLGIEPRVAATLWQLRYHYTAWPEGNRHSLPMEKTSTRSIFAEDPIDPPPPPKEGKGGEEGEGVMEHKWPELARFAYDVQSIPAMSTECERCFSSGSKTLGGRWTLDGESIEACEVSGAVDLTSIRLDSHNYPPVMLGHRSIPMT
jgi:hypothetical protein